MGNRMINTLSAFLPSPLLRTNQRGMMQYFSIPNFKIPSPQYFRVRAKLSH